MQQFSYRRAPFQRVLNVQFKGQVKPPPAALAFGFLEGVVAAGWQTNDVVSQLQRLLKCHDLRAQHGAEAVHLELARARRLGHRPVKLVRSPLQSADTNPANLALIFKRPRVAQSSKAGPA